MTNFITRSMSKRFTSELIITITILSQNVKLKPLNRKVIITISTLKRKFMFCPKVEAAITQADCHPNIMTSNYICHLLRRQLHITIRRR